MKAGWIRAKIFRFAGCFIDPVRVCERINIRRRFAEKAAVIKIPLQRFIISVCRAGGRLFAAGGRGFFRAASLPFSPAAGEHRAKNGQDGNNGCKFFHMDFLRFFSCIVPPGVKGGNAVDCICPDPRGFLKAVIQNKRELPVKFIFYLRLANKG